MYVDFTGGPVSSTSRPREAVADKFPAGQATRYCNAATESATCSTS
jgi:hypothetical protein